MRRPAPRPLATALADVTRERAPATLLARVQSVWSEVAGPAVGAEAEPVAEREGTVTVECRSAVWAQELDLLAHDLLPRLNERLGPAAAVRGLRFVTGSRRAADSGRGAAGPTAPRAPAPGSPRPPAPTAPRGRASTSPHDPG